MTDRGEDRMNEQCPAYREYDLQCALPAGHEGDHRGTTTHTIPVATRPDTPTNGATQ